MIKKKMKASQSIFLCKGNSPKSKKKTVNLYSWKDFAKQNYTLWRKLHLLVCFKRLFVCLKESSGPFEITFRIISRFFFISDLEGCSLKGGDTLCVSLNFNQN